MSTLQSTSSPSMSYFSTPNQMGGDVATEAFFSPTPQGSLRSSGSSNPGFAHQQGQNFASTAQLTQDFSQMGTSSQSSPAIGSSNYASNLQQPLGDYNSGESRLFPVISRQQFQAQFATNDLPPQASGSTQVAQANVDDNWMLSDLTSLRSPGLKRFAGDHLEDPRPRSPGTSGSLRRPASFPILSSVGSNGAVPVPINDAVPQAQASSSTGPHRRTISNNANNNAMTTSRVNLRRLASGTGPVVGGSPQHHQQQQQQQQQQLRGGVKMGDRADMRHHRSNLSLSALSQYPGSHPPPSDAVEGSLVESPLTSSSLSSFNGGTAGGPQFTFSVPSNSGYASGSHLNGSGNNQGAHPSASAGLASERRGQDERERNLGGAAHFSTVSSLPIVGHLPNTQYSHPTPSARTSPITSLQAATPVSYQQQKMNTSPYSTANGGLGFDISSRPSRASSGDSYPQQSNVNGNGNGSANGNGSVSPPQLVRASQLASPPLIGSQTPSRGTIALTPGGYPSSSNAMYAQHPPLPSASHSPQQLQSGSSSSPNGNDSPSPTGRAKLELHGDLGEMSSGWTHDEWARGRRLVQFWRKQEGTTIHCTFGGIDPSEYVPRSIVVSCIYRADKDECFVTSVDTIYLLESLVASQFTIEEKNRIRRNLEGFRPATISKTKEESEEFFKLIMGFGTPKPRNIEKDVKVFPWKVLAEALKKIIGKYSASVEPPLASPHAPYYNDEALQHQQQNGFNGHAGHAVPHYQYGHARDDSVNLNNSPRYFYGGNGQLQGPSPVGSSSAYLVNSGVEGQQGASGQASASHHYGEGSANGPITGSMPSSTSFQGHYHSQSMPGTLLSQAQPLYQQQPQQQQQQQQHPGAIVIGGQHAHGHSQYVPHQAAQYADHQYRAASGHAPSSYDSINGNGSGGSMGAQEYAHLNPGGSSHYAHHSAPQHVQSHQHHQHQQQQQQQQGVPQHHQMTHGGYMGGQDSGATGLYTLPSAASMPEYAGGFAGR